MKIKLFLSFLLLSFCFFSIGQNQGNGGYPKSFSETQDSQNMITKVKLPTPNIVELRLEDEQTDLDKSGPWRFAYNHISSINMNNSGTWSNLRNGGKIWQINIKSLNALTLNFFLKEIQLPKGNELFLYNPEKTFVLGSFNENHVYKGELGTELIPGDEAIIEYYISPENLTKPFSLAINMIGHGYRTAEEFQEKAFRSSGTCNMNVACADGLPWENQIRSAVMLVSGGVNGSGFCSGAMINNTNNDGKPYVLTANHCYSNPTSWVFRFNWQSSTCQQPNSSPSYNSLSGATLRARKYESDFCLVEITGGLENNTVPLNYNTYFAGWDRTQNQHTAAVSVHHPSGDIKKISFDDNPPTIHSYNSIANNTWRVVWDRNTTTERGSSGSPLFNQEGLIIGQLWGGNAGCSNLSGYDAYGAVFKSWEDSPNIDSQLKHWLDPYNIQANTLNGYDPKNSATVNNAGIQNISSPSTDKICTSSIIPKVVLKNYGSANLTSVQILSKVNGTVVNTYNWNGNLATNNTVNVDLPSISLAFGSHTLTFETSLPNGQADENTSNDSQTKSMIVDNKPNEIKIEILTDCYSEETRWQIKDINNVVVEKGGNITVPGENQTGTYDRNHSSKYPQSSLITVNTCLNNGCYIFTIFDQGRDGLEAVPYGCPINGSYSITNGQSQAYVTMLQPNFGATKSHNFCVETNVSTHSMDLVELNIYPNPSNGKFIVDWNEKTEQADFDVLDITGRKVTSGKLEQNKQTIDLQHLSSGKYLFKVSTENGVIMKTIVLQ